jgi:hypothetical protein
MVAYLTARPHFEEFPVAELWASLNLVPLVIRVSISSTRSSMLHSSRLRYLEFAAFESKNSN